jgi:hypothetical protein
MSAFLIAGKRISRTLLDIASKSGFQMKTSFLSFVSLVLVLQWFIVAAME